MKLLPVFLVFIAGCGPAPSQPGLYTPLDVPEGTNAPIKERCDKACAKLRVFACAEGSYECEQLCFSIESVRPDGVNFQTFGPKGSQCLIDAKNKEEVKKACEFPCFASQEEYLGAINN